MKREQFVREYAERSGLDPQWASIGIVEVGKSVMFALPCGCDDDTCQGWAMLTGNSVLDHLFFHAPEALRDAYRLAVDDAENR